MPYVINLFYLLLLTFLSPGLLWKMIMGSKYRRGLWQKILGLAPRRSGDRPCVWFHGVSVGEVLLLRPVIAEFRKRHPHWDCVLSTTTDTAFDEARKRYPDLTVFFWPLDFTWAVRRALQHIQPDLVVLAESELWPNFLMAARRAQVPVAVVNGRMSPRSFQRYRWWKPLSRWLLGHLDLCLMQNGEYAENLRALHPRPESVHVTGNVKYDGLQSRRDNPATQRLRELLAVQPNELVWIAGSTQAPEEEIALHIYRKLRVRFPRLRLILVPRQKDRFDEVARLLQKSGMPFVRRSALADCGLPMADSSKQAAIDKPLAAIILVDTIGELGALWGLADVAYVGGSMDGQRGGQNMIEPAAYGVAVTFGPHTWNFKHTVEQLLAQDAAIQVADAADLERTTERLLVDVEVRRLLGAAARRYVLTQQGATARTVELLTVLVQKNQRKRRAA